MRLTVTVIDLSRGESWDAAVEALPEATVGALAGELVNGRAQAPVLYVDGEPLAPDLTLADAPIRDGTVVSLDDPDGCPPPLPDGVAELRITGGPRAGGVHRLMPATWLVGRGPRANLRVDDPYLPAEAFTLSLTPDGRGTLTLQQGTHARLDGEPVSGRVSWSPGAQLAAGASLFELARPARPDAVLEVSADRAGLDYNRPPRVRPLRTPTRFRLPAPPRQAESAALPIVTALLPVMLAVGSAVLLQQWAYLLLGLLSPIGLVAQHQVEKRRGRKTAGEAMSEYRRRRAQIEQDARQALAADAVQRRHDHPDPAQVLVTAIGPTARLWVRHPDDLDFLTVRVGTGDVGSDVRLEDPQAADDDRRETAWKLRDAPVTLPLSEFGVLGVAGEGGLSRALGRWIVAQLATLHSPADVTICLLTGPSTKDDWAWIRWLPHVRPDGRPLIGNDDETVRRRITELTGLLAARQRGSAPYPQMIIVLDGAQRLRGLPGVVQLLKDGPAVDIRAVCLDSDERRLPAECVATVVAEGAALRVHRSGARTIDQVRPDLVDARWCTRLARALAPIRDISDRGESARLPDSVRLLDLLDLDPPAAGAIAHGWRAGGGRSTEAVIGVGLDGPARVDLRRDGPHGLVAGTTGAGKSELLQTLIAALAVANRPDEMTFVLIDYKGGSAFQDCAKLPHTVGMVTDLDGHLTERALESLAAELRRRERILLGAGAKDIDDYHEKGDEPLPRLTIVIDEFASLVAELPDFVAGLVDIARRGRSLGVHLILATQRPAGVVTADIRANTNLRIALRVTDVSESSDVIDAPDAAGIAKSTPGRCYVRSGASSLRAVQSARIGGRRPVVAAAVPPPRVTPVEWHASAPPAAEAQDQSVERITDLATLVEAIGAAAEDIPRQAGPWLPPLPEKVIVDELPGIVAFGLTDLPKDQARGVLSLSLEEGGHLAVVGSAQSGRSTVLRTIAGSLAARVAPDDAHVYAIDAGANALLPLVSLPHCGAVVSRDQVERMDRLLARLAAEVARRQQLLAAAGFAGLAEQRAAAAPAERLPWMLLLLDQWEGFVAGYENYDYGRLVDTVVRLLREGPAVGLRAVVTGDRTVLSGQISTVFDRRLVLRLAEPSDYGFAGINERAVPSSMPPGRALEPGPGGELLESQVALLDPDPSGVAQVAALQRLARAAPAAGAQRPLRVDDLPVRVTVDDLDLGSAPDAPLWTLVGAGGDGLGPVGVDLMSEGPGFTIAGPPRSGRSTALYTMARCLQDRGVPLVVVTPRRSPLRDLPDSPIADDADFLMAAIAGLSRYALLVDDAELLRDTPLDDALADVLRAARDGEHGVVLAGLTDDLKSAYRGFAADALRSRSGLLLAVRSPDDGDMFGVRLPRNAGGAGPAGRGILVRLGIPEPVQVAVTP